MDTIKLSVTIELPGRAVMTSQECDENPQENYEYTQIVSTSQYYDKAQKEWIVKKKYKNIIIGRKCKPAYQTINMSEEAYNHMISTVYPEWYKGGANGWKRLSKREKLEVHMQRLCENFKGKSYTYTVFDE